MSYRKNKVLAIFNNKKPTRTDQAAAHETDRHVIVNRFLQTGQYRPGTKQPQYADFASLPQDLRGMLEMARSTEKLRQQLPKELQHLSTAQLLALTPQELTNILTPPAPAGDNQEKPDNEDLRDQRSTAGLLPEADGVRERQPRRERTRERDQQPGGRTSK